MPSGHRKHVLVNIKSDRGLRKIEGVEMFQEGDESVKAQSLCDEF